MSISKTPGMARSVVQSMHANGTFGCYCSMQRTHASFLKTMPGLEALDALDNKIFKDQTIRQVQQGQVDAQNTNISSFWTIADVGKVFIFKDACNARTWSKNSKQVNKEIAPSLTWVDTGHPSVSFLNLF